MSVGATVFMFSGQGSQYYQMGRALFDSDGVFRQQMLRLDEMARELSGGSVLETLYSSAGKAENFDRTMLTHPAIFMVEYSLAQSLIRAGVTPDVVLGASVGSFAAAAVAGFLSVEDALAAVIQQAVSFERYCEPGGMLAVFADPQLFVDESLSRHSELAGINFATHFVLAARPAQLATIEAELRTRAVAHQRLPVCFAFHSQWIDPAQASFESFMRSIRCTKGRLPLACCGQAALLSELSADYFWRIVRQPIRFREALAQLERAGAHRYIDVGPASTLATFLKYGLPVSSGSTAHAILTPFGHEQKNFAAVVASRSH